MKKQQIILSIFLLIATSLFAQGKKYTTYTVQKKETVTSIARKFGITPHDLLKLNPDAINGINIDEKLIVPKKHFKVVEKRTIGRSSQKANSKLTQSNKLLNDSIVDGYLYHKVKAYETVYSLSKKYKVSKRKVRKLNKLNRRADLSIGQLLKFPYKGKKMCAKPPQNVKEDPAINTQPENTTNFIQYTVQAKDTFYGLKQVYNVTKEKLISINSQLKDGLKEGTVILIPTKTGNINERISQIKPQKTISVPTYKLHTVMPKEGFFRLKQLYGYTKEEILKMNPEIIDGLKVGMVIKIPKKAEEIVMAEGNLQGKLINVLMMLPFNTNLSTRFSDNTKAANRLNKTAEFYMGALMAFDDLKRKGLSVNIKVTDTNKSTKEVENILQVANLSTTDVIIGPLDYKLFQTAAKIVANNNIPIISPISSKNHRVINKKNVIQNVPVKNILEDKMLAYINKKYTNQNLIIVSGNTIDEKANAFRVKTFLLKNDSIKKVTILELKDGYIKREIYDKNIVKNKKNWIIITTNKKKTDFENKFSDAVEAIGAYGSEFKITLFALKKPKSIDRKSKNDGDDDTIDTANLNRLNFHYPIANFINNNNVKVYTFTQNFKSRFGKAPGNFAYKGYDTTYDALMRIANSDKYDQAFEAGASKRLQTKYVYRNNNGFYNDGVYILKYANYELIEVE